MKGKDSGLAIGFVGLGVMGTPMVTHLHRHGHTVALPMPWHETTRFPRRCLGWVFSCGRRPRVRREKGRA